MKPNEYWEQNSAYRDQQFYAAFCILASACSDYAVGAELRFRNKLNWACIVLYYSLVHAARLTCFVETGDFPTKHKELGDLFSQGSLRVSSSWVKSRLQPHDNHVEPITEFRLVGLSGENRIQLGQILTEARKLRSDVNYEGLLISNEYSHEKVTECFERLAKILNIASEQQIPKMVEVFKNFVDESPRTDYWYAFLNWERGHNGIWSVSDSIPLGEGLFYLEASLRYRGASKKVIAKVLHWLDPLRREPDLDARLAKEVLGNIVMSVFALKSRLFGEFETKIDSFYRSCGDQIDA